MYNSDKTIEVIKIFIDKYKSQDDLPLYLIIRHRDKIKKLIFFKSYKYYSLRKSCF